MYRETKIPGRQSRRGVVREEQTSSMIQRYLERLQFAGVQDE